MRTFDEPQRLQPLVEPARPGALEPAVVYGTREAPVHLAEQLALRGVGDGQRPVVKAAVELLDHQPAARLQRRDQLGQRRLPLGDVTQHKPGMNEIERRLGQRVGADVVALQVYVGRPLRPLDEPQVQVGDQHAPRRPDAPGQPGRNLAAAATDLQAVPAGADARRFEKMEGAAVVERRSRDAKRSVVSASAALPKM